MPASERMPTEVFVAEAYRRAALIESARHRVRTAAVATVSGIVGIAAVVGLALVLGSVLPKAPASGNGVDDAATATGAPDVGGYLLVGVACFILGVVVALVSVRYAARRQGGSRPGR